MAKVVEEGPTSTPDWESLEGFVRVEVQRLGAGPSLKLRVNTGLMLVAEELVGM